MIDAGGQATESFMMQDLNNQLIQHLETGETVAVATVVRRKGSVPREVGAKMLVQRGGKISGTVGGGCGEAEVWRAALNVIDTHRPAMVQVDLTEEIAMESQGVCGGIFDVFVQPWRADSGQKQLSALEIARAIAGALESERAAALATVIEAGGAWRGLVGHSLLVHEMAKRRAR
jgi:xanthine dehydrogenase accessory factor